MTAEVHEYLSTACWHELHEGRSELHISCRLTCKFGDEPCFCPNHPENDGRALPPSWVDQAREVARALLAQFQAIPDGLTLIADALLERLRTDPALFWLRGEEKPHGVWRPPAEQPIGERLIDPDCRDGKCGSCVGGPCEHECHQADAAAKIRGETDA